MNLITQFWRDPAMPYAESRRACHSRACYKPHSHPTFSIGAVDQGVSCFTGAAEGPLTLQAGTLVFVPAFCVHACNPELGTAWSYQMLHLDADWLQAVRAECAPENMKNRENEPIRIVAEPAIYVRFCRLNTLLFSQIDPRDKEAALIEFIGEWDEGRGQRISTRVISPNLGRQIDPILDLLQEKPAINMDLSDLAQLAGMSRYQLIRAFRAATGMTPHAWQLNQRINLAREWIRTGEGLAEVAYRLGFADQAHFQRVFKAHAGITPGGFRT
ncbi:AraC family transcriptional regulator [Castellaniella sp.]|uniref:AraC family transcriptional regulator n=1 Tax=Castellaniella sp. TaxID=1955812 RepID=UPI002AFECFC2|nr:AraC family transcriptional regulator [Castellaniella sp.]